MCIQRCFKKFLKNRYDYCKNNEDDDIFTLSPVYMIPRDLLVIIDKQAFNACHLLKWVSRSGKHPLTREDVPEEVVGICVNCIKNFLYFECIKSSIGNKTGFYKKRKQYTQALKLLDDDDKEK